MSLRIIGIFLFYLVLSVWNGYACFVDFSPWPVMRFVLITESLWFLIAVWTLNQRKSNV